MTKSSHSNEEPPEFTAWYYDQWSHGETSPVHHAHKAGCLMAWQAAKSQLPTQGDVDTLLLQISEALQYADGQRQHTSEWVMATLRNIRHHAEALSTMQPVMSEPPAMSEDAVVDMAVHIMDGIRCLPANTTIEDQTVFLGKEIYRALIAQGVVK